MATTNANESRVQRQYRFQPEERNSRYKDLKPKDRSLRMNPAPYQKSWNNNRNSFLDKDEEEGNRTLRSHKTADSKPKNQLEQSEKFVAIKRLERDRKAMQRKLREEETEKPKRPAMKQKRSSKSDWTKDYEYDLIDEE